MTITSEKVKAKQEWTKKQMERAEKVEAELGEYKAWVTPAQQRITKQIGNINGHISLSTQLVMLNDLYQKVKQDSIRKETELKNVIFQQRQEI